MREARINFDEQLTSIAGADRKARLELIDKYDALRKKSGYHAARTWIAQQAKTKESDVVRHLLTIVRDDAARRIIQAALDHGDLDKLEWMESRLTETMIADAIMYCGMDEDSIFISGKTSLERSRLRTKVKQSVNQINLALGATGGKYGYKLCTPYELNQRRRQIEKQEEWARDQWVWSSKLNVTCNLLEVMKNKGFGRMAEVLAIAVGLQEFGDEEGLIPLFYTLTAPPYMHPNPTQSDKNTWDGTSPKKAHQWIHKNHRAAFQILSEEGVLPAGLRTVEGHDDECPHWHCIAWVKPGEQVRFEDVFRNLKDAPSWAIDVGFKCKNMNDEPDNGKAKAKAVHYAFKYILKSIGGFKAGDVVGKNKETGEDILMDKELADAIERQDCWRSKHGIRGYQFFGLPQLKLWRELRKSPNSNPSSDDYEPLKDHRIEEARQAAREGRGRDFIELAGGLNVKQKNRPLASKIIISADREQKSLILLNRITGRDFEQKLHIWKIIDTKTKESIDADACAPRLEVTDDEDDDQDSSSLTVIQKHPRTATPFDDESYFSKEGIIVAQPNAPNLIFWQGDWYPF